jgi:ketosteroid isomerase-like protein
MSQENVELVRAWFEAWNRADLAWQLKQLSADFEFRTSGIFPTHDAMYRGTNGYAKFWHTFHDAWERLSIDLHRVEDVEDHVVALFAFHAIGRGSGVEVTRKTANVFEFGDGLVGSISAYAEWETALEAVGLSE